MQSSESEPIKVQITSVRLPFDELLLPTIQIIAVQLVLGALIALVAALAFAGGAAAKSFSLPAADVTVQVQPGKKRVEIRHSRKVGENEMGAIMEQYIPDRYNDKSELEADISAARSDLEFKLTSK